MFMAFICRLFVCFFFGLMSNVVVLDWKILQVVTYIHILPNTILSKRSLLNYLEIARTKLNLFLV